MLWSPAYGGKGRVWVADPVGMTQFADFAGSQHWRAIQISSKHPVYRCRNTQYGRRNAKHAYRFAGQRSDGLCNIAPAVTVLLSIVEFEYPRRRLFGQAPCDDGLRQVGRKN